MALIKHQAHHKVIMNILPLSRTPSEQHLTAELAYQQPFQSPISSGKFHTRLSSCKYCFHFVF